MDDLLESLDMRAAKGLYDVSDWETYKKVCTRLLDSGKTLSLSQLQFITAFKISKINDVWFKSMGDKLEPL